MPQTVTTNQTNEILLDSGVVYIDYGEATERILAPTRGGSTFVVEQEIRLIERDGSLGKEKGLRRIIREDAMLTVRLMEISMENLEMVLRGSTLATSTITPTQNGTISATEYLTNVTWIGEDLEGKSKVITLYNAMVDNGLNLNAVDKDEAVLEVVFSAHRDPADYTSAPYTIVETSTAAGNLTGLVASAGSFEPTFAGGTYSYGLAVANGVTSTTITPTGASADWIKVNGTTVASGAASGAIALSVGVNQITIRVHEDEKADIEYKIYITRAD